MALNPDEVRYAQGGAEITQENATGDTRTISVDVQGASSFPDAHLGAGAQTLTITQTTNDVSGLGLPDYGTGIAIVEDDTDVAGNYLHSDVVDRVWLGQPSLAPSTVQVTLPTSGVYRIVLIVAQDQTQAWDSSEVNTGATSFEFHYNSDGAGNDRAGVASTASVSGTRAVGVIGALATVSSLSAPDNNKYGESFWLSVSLNPVGSSTFRETWQVRLAISETSADSIVNGFNVTPNTSGTVVSSTTNVDTDYSLTPQDYFLQVGVNNTLGQASTPAGQRPGIYSEGTVVGVTTSQRSWVAFDTTGHGAGITRASASRAYDAGTTTVASGINLAATPYYESGRTNVSAGFTRPASTSTPNGTAYMRAVITDGYGAVLPNVDVILRILDSDGTVEDSQNLTTDGSGVVDWDWSISTTDKAFNRFRYTSPDSPDALGAHDGLFAAYKPSGKTGDYPDPIDGSVDRSFDGEQPARAKDVELEGRAFGGVEEPSDSQTDVLGVSSEIIFAGMWSGNTDQRTIDANGAPTGIVTRSKVTAAGSYAFKTSGLIDEANFAAADTSDENPTDIWGRAFDNHVWVGRRAVYNRTDSDIIDGGTALSATEQLDDPLGYSNHGSETATFDLVSPTADASTLAYYQAFHRTTAGRATFQLTSGEVVGFTGDTEVYGYKCQIVEYSVVRDDLAIVCAASEGLIEVGGTQSVIATGVTILPDNRTIATAFDGPPRMNVHRIVDLSSALSKTDAVTMENIAGTDDWAASFSPAVAGAYQVTVFGKVGGSRPAPGRASFFAGFDTDIKMLVTTEVTQSDSGLTRRFVVKGVREDGGVLTAVDFDAAPSYHVVAAPETGAMTVIASGTATAIGTPPTGDYEFDVTIPSSQKAIKVYVTGTVDGAPVIGGDVQSVQVGFALDAVGTLVGIHFK